MDTETQLNSESQKAIAQLLKPYLQKADSLLVQKTYMAETETFIIPKTPKPHMFSQ